MWDPTTHPWHPAGTPCPDDADADPAHAQRPDPWADPQSTAAARSAAHVDALIALSDAPIEKDVLDAFLPLWQRWPEPRALDQAETFWMPDRDEYDVSRFDPDDAAVLLRSLLDDADAFHEAAVHDERFTTSTGMRAAMRTAGIELVEDMCPVCWIESTVMVRTLRRMAGVRFQDDA